MSIVSPVLVLSIIFLSSNVWSAHAQAQHRLIVAGQSIGRLKIGAEMDSAVKSLGATSDEDGASGRLRLTWISKGSKSQRLDVIGERDFNATRNVDAFYIRQMRVTSPFFRLRNGIKTGDSLRKLQEHFPDLRVVGTSKFAGHRATVYDAKNAGIAFEISEKDKRRPVLSIIVHRKGRRVNQDYLMAVQGFESLP